MRSLDVFTIVFIALAATMISNGMLPALIRGSADTEVCKKNSTRNTTMQCGNCAGNLTMDFGPYRLASYYYESDHIRDVTCTVNKPANVTVFFNQYMKPFDDTPSDFKTRGITINKLNGGCTYTIKFPAVSASLCHFGVYTCKAVTDTNETISKSQRVEGNFGSRNQPFDFKVEDRQLQETKELIIGSSANLSCSIISRDWNRGFFRKPFILFWRLSDKGTAFDVKDTFETPKKYETQGSTEKTQYFDQNIVGTRRLYLRNIDAGANGTYLCRVKLMIDNCRIEKKLVLRTRPCKIGHYCNRNSSEELPCRAGTYSNITGLFNVSGCRTCPLNSYCPLASSVPILCPMSRFSPAKMTKLKIFEGKRSKEECRHCPVNPCDQERDKCTFICSNGPVSGVLGQAASINCTLSNAELLQNLTWSRKGKKIVESSSYKIYQEDNQFVLKIHKLSREDVGDYNCSGVDMIMGTHVYSTVPLLNDVTQAAGNSDNNANLLLPFLLSLFLVLLFVVSTGFLVRKYWLHSRGSGGHRAFMEMETNHISETFRPDVRVVLEGNIPKYDAFLCYSSADKTWVRRTLLPTLRSYNLRVCIDFEDFEAGTYIIENIADAIFSSRKTIAVLSPDFVESDWCQKELMMASTQIRNRHKVIPVMYRECKVPRFLCDVTYLDWCNEDVRVTFWEQLIRTMNDGSEQEMSNGVVCTGGKTNISQQ